MPVRSTMAALIARERILINDVSGSPIFSDQTLQDVLDESRVNLRYLMLNESPTYSGSSLLYLDYYLPRGNANIEDDYTLWQYLTVSVTAASAEPILGHFTFAASTLPPVYIIGKSYDIYRAAADLLERQAAMWSTAYAFSSDGQSFQRQQAMVALLDLAHTYRGKQRVRVAQGVRGDLALGDSQAGNGGPVALDYFSSGDPGR